MPFEPTTAAPTLAWLIVSQSAGPASIIGSTNGRTSNGLPSAQATASSSKPTSQPTLGAVQPGCRNPPNRPMSTAVRGGPLATIVVRWTCCREPDPDRGTRMDVRPDAARSPGCRPATTGSRRAASTGRTAGPAGRSRRRSRWARPGSRSSRRSRPRRREPSMAGPASAWGTDWTVRPSIDTGNGSRCGRVAPTTVRGAGKDGEAAGAAEAPGFALGASRTAARSSGVAVRPRTAAPITATSSRTGTSSTSRASARRRRDGGLVGTGSTIIALPTVRAPGVRGCRYPRTR